MNADTKHNNVMVAIHVISNALSELSKVAKEDGFRGEDMSLTIEKIWEIVNGVNTTPPSLIEWLEWLEADLEPEK